MQIIRRGGWLAALRPDMMTIGFISGVLMRFPAVALAVSVAFAGPLLARALDSGETMALDIGPAT